MQYESICQGPCAGGLSLGRGAGYRYLGRGVASAGGVVSGGDFDGLGSSIPTIMGTAAAGAGGLSRLLGSASARI